MRTPRLSARVLIPAALGAATLVGFGAGALLQPGAANAATTTTTKTNAADAMKKCDGGPGRRAPLDDATAAKVKAAALKAVPGATVDKVGHDRGDGYIAMLTKSDGTTHVLVHEDKDFKVTKVDDPAPARPARGPGDRGPGHGRGDGPRGPRPDKNTAPTTPAS